MAKPKGKRGGVRKSKAESMTGAKAAKVEVRGGMGDNAPEMKLPAPDDFLHHMKSIKGCKEKLETAKSLVSHAKKAANKSCAGLSKTIERLIGIERENDPFAFQREMEMLGLGLKVTNSPIQLSVFDTLAGDVEDQAYKRGVSDGEAGRSASNPYPENSDLAESYSSGWRHGTGKNLGLSPGQVDAATGETANSMPAE